jgi:hypothetical protein
MVGVGGLEPPTSPLSVLRSLISERHSSRYWMRSGAAAVAERVGVVETAADFFKKRAGKAAVEGLMKFLRTAPKLAPEPDDTLR